MADSTADTGLLGPGLLRRGADRAGLSFPQIHPVRLAAIFAAVTWAPMAILSAVEGRFVGPGWVLSRDVAMYVRLLLVGPVLLAMGPFVDRQLGGVIPRWRDSPLIPPDRVEALDRFMSRLHALRRSYWPELAVLLVAYGLTYLAFSTRSIQADQPWLFARGGARGLSLAGWWCALVSGPLFFHVFLWWLCRFGLWTAILIRLVTLPVRVLGTHPDGVGGLDPLARAHNLLLWLPAAVSSVAAGGLANAILHQGAALEGLRQTELSLVVVHCLLFLGPLLIFTPALLAARRRMSSRYGAVAARHASLLEHEIDGLLEGDSGPRAGATLGDELLESQANLAQSFATVLTTRAALVNRANLVLFAVAAGGPLLALEAMEIPASQLVSRLKGVLL